MLKDDRPGFGFPAESYQKTFKVGIHSQRRRQKNFQVGQQKNTEK